MCNTLLSTRSLPSRGESIDFILAPGGSDFKAKHFKFLGRWIHYYIEEADIKLKIREDFKRDVEIVANAQVNGLQKLWLYHHYIISRHSWP